VIDRAGRLQLPKEAIEQIPFNGRAEVRITEDHVELWPISSELNGNGSGSDDVPDRNTQAAQEEREWNR
jgi:hypothetical protein